MSDLLRCQSCGGVVVWDARQSGAACLFCGSLTLEVQQLEEPLPVPDAWLPMQVSAPDADDRFRAWATSSWFRPAILRTTAIELRPMLLPAWRFHSALETHWAGLRRAATKSGKAPVSGVEHLRLHHMVPASAGLSQAELYALQPFDEQRAAAWTRDGATMIWEPPALTRRGAKLRAHRDLAADHMRRISAAHQLVHCKVSPVIEDEDVRLLMVPIYIGAFRFRDRPWRFLINGQSGEVVGEAPVDRVKVFLVVLGVLAAILVVGLIVSVLQ
ncbi:hypothetical protein G6O69_33920 [Pseudenhygromyxa sp. WMMC2535]|uniref:hypothetical protein n=1 Tax=Pseudenhygromyxa sp. WMMC2535 TaxID=2712867 RepID=UPI001551ECD5|nr:hypothetical protein [Pseudenhygromyxa sp. WMMC2535]NVB42868.1 hypothetical protein [Pseudenhygromyxa sp. WMMC2535]